MKLVRVSAVTVLGVGTLCGCAYFNGLYNANVLAREAVRAEREGRANEARSLWSRVAVKAESVAVRYPESKYYDDALLLRGQALFAAGQLESAMAPLALAAATSQDRGIVERAQLVLGRCRLASGEADSAIAAFSRVVPSDDTVLASAAHLWRGRARASLGHYEQAAADFRASSLVDAAFDLAVAQARLGLREQAEALLSWRVDGDYHEQLWLATLDSTGAIYPDLAATVVDLLLERKELSRRQRGTLLIRDGDRWDARGEIAKALTRFRQAFQEARTGDVADAARLRAVLAELRGLDDLGRLPAMLNSLSGMPNAAASTQPSFADVMNAVGMAAAILEYSSGGAGATNDWIRSNPDLEMFLSAEALRDKVRARPLAAAMFEEVARRFPSSELAPKALLAAATLEPGVADSLVAAVRRRYPLSPYTLVLSGSAHDAYAALEDSLRTLILARRGAS